MDTRDGGDIPVLLVLTSRVITDQMHARLATSGHPDVRPAHGYVFQYLSFRAATTVELAAHLGVTKQAAGQLVDELERRGYLVRQPHPTDRRARVLALTDRGWDCINKVTGFWREVEHRWADLIGPDRLAALRADLNTYIAATAGPQPPPMRPLW